VTLTTSVKAAFLGAGSFSGLCATSCSASRPLSNLKPKPQTADRTPRLRRDLIHKVNGTFSPSVSEYAQTRTQGGIKKTMLVTRFPKYFSAQFCPQCCYQIASLLRGTSWLPVQIAEFDRLCFRIHRTGKQQFGGLTNTPATSAESRRFMSLKRWNVIDT